MTACRGCGKSDLSRVLDLGKVPAADYFPLATDPVRAEEASHALGHGRLPRLWSRATGRRRHGRRRAARRRAAGAEGPGRGRDRAGRRGGLAAREHRPRVRQPARRHLDPAARRARVHDGRRRRRTWCWTASASCTNRTSAAPSRGAPRSPTRAACCCCSTTRSSRSSSRASGMRCGTGISRTTR